MDSSTMPVNFVYMNITFTCSILLRLSSLISTLTVAHLGVICLICLCGCFWCLAVWHGI